MVSSPDTRRWHICRTVIPQKGQGAPGEFSLEGLLDRLEKLSLHAGPMIDFDRIGFRAMIARAETLPPPQTEGTDWFTPPGSVIEREEYQIEESPGDWYVRLLASVDAIILAGDEHDAAVLLLSLGPPGATSGGSIHKNPFCKRCRSPRHRASS
jgi:hypothetical protein